MIGPTDLATIWESAKQGFGAREFAAVVTL